MKPLKIHFFPHHIAAEASMNGADLSTAVSVNRELMQVEWPEHIIRYRVYAGMSSIDQYRGLAADDYWMHSEIRNVDPAFINAMNAIVRR